MFQEARSACESPANTHMKHSSAPLRMEALLNEWLMLEEFWLPPGVRWKDIEMTEDEGRFPLPRDLIYTLPLAFAFIALRYVFER